jgi:DNA (cytosine-5)-methyltransferase 1
MSADAIYIHSRESGTGGGDTPNPQTAYSSLTLGSLFDGSGGFPLGGLLAGITPLWASEIEPFPIRVTTKRLPSVKHLGDINSIRGDEIEPVDIITFGSPCTDMSVAGKRAGLGGQQSCLFYQAIRIVEEMRCATDGKYPRFIVWENVPGAFSSNKGEDFKAVLEAVCSVKGEGVPVPGPPKGKWANAGNIVGDGFSLAWRVLDAQFWGVPQRRKRIYLVADFAGGSAGKILFESEGVSGYSAEGFRAWQGTAGGAADCIGAAGGICLNDQGGQRMDVTDDVTCTLRAEAHHPPCVLESAGFCTEHSAQARGIGYEEETSPTLRTGTIPAAVALENHPADSRVKLSEDGRVQTLTSRMGTGGGNVPMVMDAETPKTLKIRSGCEGGGKGAIIQDDKSATLSCNNDQTVFVPFCKGYRAHYKGDAPTWKDGKVANTLNTFDVGESRCNELVVQAYGICSKDSNAMKSDNPHSGFYEADTSRTLDGNGGNPSCNQGGIAVVSVQGSMIGREDKNGPQGSGVNEDVSFTLNATDHHAVAYPTYCTSKNSHFTRAEKELANTLVATDYKDPPVVNDVQAEPEYIVRRLTPTECARLQGFPDWWCSGLGTEEPTEDDLAFWREVFETHRKIMGTSTKPKTDKQIIKWLKEPHSDSAEYKMWGNGVALPNVYFVLSGIVFYAQFPDFLL